nr:hypothetical protein [Tanacetum cinerariifolium]
IRLSIEGPADRHQRVFKDSLSAKPQRATSNVFKSKTSSKNSKITSYSSAGMDINWDHLRKFDEKADDGFFLGYSPVAKAFSVFNIKSDVQPTPILSPSAEGTLQHPIPQDRWLREKHIKLVNIIGEPIAGITTKSDVRDSKAASAHECLYVDFLSKMEPKKIIEALEEEGIFMYLKGTPNLGLYLKAYSDSDYAGCNLDRKRTSGAYQILSGKLVCWSVNKKSSKAMSSAKTDAIAISNNPVLHSRIKHIDIMYYFIKDHILKGDIELHFVPTDLQLADILTKPLAEPSFTRLVAELGMLNIQKRIPDKKKALSDL